MLSEMKIKQTVLLLTTAFPKLCFTELLLIAAFPKLCFTELLLTAGFPKLLHGITADSSISQTASRTT
jgi:hypothetical protein